MRILFSPPVFLGLFIFNVTQANDVIIKKCQTKNGGWRYSSTADNSCLPDISILNEQGAIIRQDKTIKPATKPVKPPISKPKKITPSVHILDQYSSLYEIEEEQSRKLAEFYKRLSINEGIANGLIKDIELLEAKPKTAAIQQGIKERKEAAENYRKGQITLKQQAIKTSLEYEEIKRKYQAASLLETQQD